MSNYADLVVHSIHRRRATFAAASAVFSVLLHLALLVWVIVVPFNPLLPHLLKPADPDQTPPMNLGSVQVQPEPVATSAESESTDEGSGGPGMDLARAAERLDVAPESFDLEPPDRPPARLSSEAAMIQEPNTAARPEPWQPRQDILDVEKTVVRDEVAARPRLNIPQVERVIKAADVVYPVEPKSLAAAAPSAEGEGLEAPSLADMLRRATDARPGGRQAAPVPDPATRSGTDILAEKPAEVSTMRPIEALLSARLVTSQDRRDPEHTYFRVEITRRNEKVLPVIPKDVLFIQDCSASLAEQRLYFCREGLIKSLPLIGPQDRFNIVSFRDQVDSCFPAWTNNTPEAQDRALAYITTMRSQGETDIFNAIRTALSFQTLPGRPVIAILITDGHSTTGLMDGTAIIREVTKANAGAVSVFTFGTSPQAYTYMLDLLSYCNRGDSRVIRNGRWDIPRELAGLAAEVSHPVLSEVRLRVAEATPCAVYPVQTMNLFSDRPLVLYGRCPRTQERLVFQAAGRAGDTVCDMIFDLNVGQPPSTTDQEDIRHSWAQQKIYHLLAEYARTRDRGLITEIDSTAKANRVNVPYRDEL